jgi:integrase
LLQRYLESAEYQRLAPATKQGYQLTAEKLLRDENIAHRLVAQMKREHVGRMVAKRAATPAAANHVLSILKVLVGFSIGLGWRDDDPTERVRRFTTGEYHSWTEEEIATFEARWPIGTRERVAFGLLLYTGQRRDDVRTMSWRDLDGPGINIVQGKTNNRLWIPLHPELAHILGQWPRTHIAILTTRFGQPFTTDGFGVWLASSIDRAGLPDRCVPHGLRKAAARRLADVGCSTHQIAAITGHKSLKEVERYTKAAEQKRLAQAAMDRLQAQGANKDSQP